MKHCFRLHFITPRQAAKAPQYEAAPVFISLRRGKSFHFAMKHSLRSYDEKMKNESFCRQYMLCSPHRRFVTEVHNDFPFKIRFCQKTASDRPGGQNGPDRQDTLLTGKSSMWSIKNSFYAFDNRGDQGLFLRISGTNRR